MLIGEKTRTAEVGSRRTLEQSVSLKSTVSCRPGTHSDMEDMDAAPPSHAALDAPLGRPLFRGDLHADGGAHGWAGGCNAAKAYLKRYLDAGMLAEYKG